jgi:hypothetical protein
MPKSRVKNTTRRKSVQCSCFLKRAAALLSSTGFANNLFSMWNMPLVDLLI